MEHNLIIGATNIRYSLDRQEVRIRRTADEPYNNLWICIVREATLEEYIRFHEDNNFRYDIESGDRYYAFYMD